MLYSCSLTQSHAKNPECQSVVLAVGNWELSSNQRLAHSRPRRAYPLVSSNLQTNLQRISPPLARECHPQTVKFERESSYTGTRTRIPSQFSIPRVQPKSLHLEIPPPLNPRRVLAASREPNPAPNSRRRSFAKNSFLGPGPSETRPAAGPPRGLHPPDPRLQAPRPHQLKQPRPPFQVPFDCVTRVQELRQPPPLPIRTSSNQPFDCHGSRDPGDTDLKSSSLRPSVPPNEQRDDCTDGRPRPLAPGRPAASWEV